MNYLKLYNKLIDKGLARGLNKRNIPFYTESHHILPRCLGGPDTEDNLVLLSAREHFIAHLLLFKIYRLSKLMFAIHRMCGDKFDSAKYEWMRKEHSKAVSEHMSNLWSQSEFKDKMLIALHKRHNDHPVSDKTKSKIANSLKLYYQNNPVTDEQRQKNRDAQMRRFKENPQTKETKKLRREACRKATGTPVCRCDEFGNILEKYNSGAEAKELLQLVGNTQNIYTACKRNKKTGRMYRSNGHFWKYQDEEGISVK